MFFLDQIVNEMYVIESSKVKIKGMEIKGQLHCSYNIKQCQYAHFH